MNIYGSYNDCGMENAIDAQHDLDLVQAFIRQYGGIVRALRELQGKVSNVKAKNLLGDAVLAACDMMDDGVFSVTEDADDYINDICCAVGDDALENHLRPVYRNLPSGGVPVRVDLVHGKPGCVWDAVTKPLPTAE